MLLSECVMHFINEKRPDGGLYKRINEGLFERLCRINKEFERKLQGGGGAEAR